MAFRFRRQDRSVARALRRIAAEQVERALAAIDAGDDPAAAVHDVRKRCKKVRGLVRLVRPSFEAYADENAEFRDIARLVGPARDDAVLRGTCERLAQRHPEIRPAPPRRFGAGGPQAAGDSLAEARERLTDARRRIAGWTLAADEWAAIGPGLMLTYMRARRALERIGAGHAPARFHELRKQVKYHWHHLRLLRPIDAAAIDVRAELAKELGDRLGEHHDLAVLEAALRRDPAAFGGARQVGTARALARRERLLLDEEALRIARRLLADGAESLTEHLGREWKRWRD